MKVTQRAWVLVLILAGPSLASADIATSSYNIGFYCSPYTESFIEGTYYSWPMRPRITCTWQTGDLPRADHYAGLFRGIVGSSTGGANSMGFATDQQLSAAYHDYSTFQQGEDVFSAIFTNRGCKICNDIQLFMSFFESEANPPPNDQWGVIRWKWGQAPPTTPDPVIIIPGILGSEQHNGEWVIDPILHTYDDLIATLDENGYTRDVDLFSFPYNWRKSNVETAVLLKEKIDEVKGVCDCDKVDLVAHSMGGLVARQYIQSDAYENDVDQLIFLGTPHLGAPKAYLMWEAGELGPPPPSFQDRVLKTILEHEGYEKRYPTLFAYLRTEPIEAVRELLSVENYVFDGSDERHYPSGYPTNSFLESLNINVNLLLNAGARIYNFVGETGGQETINEIHVVDGNQHAPMWLDGYPEGFYENSGNPGIVEGQGDKTVPLTSSSFITSNLVVTPHEHGALPTKTEGDVYQILAGKAADTLIERFINIPNFRLILIKILSPADLLVVGPDGKKIGKDLNGQEVNEILNAFYTGFNTDTEFLTILNPLDGEYKIYAKGTGSGSYTVETNMISDATTKVASFTGNTVPGITSQLNLDVEDGGIAPDALEVIVTYDSTLADLERLYGVGHAHFGIYKSLKAQLQAAKKAPPVVAKRLLQNMLKQLKGYRGKFITEQGYQILRTDIEQLINN